jgi:hypothetical protein
VLSRLAANTTIGIDGSTAENHMGTSITEIKDRLLAPYNGLKVAWFDTWHPALDEALRSLPEMETCPHELFRLLTQNHSSAPKKTALVTERGVPVAVVGLRHKGRRAWEPVTQWIAPGALFPAMPGYCLPALEALRIDVWIAWWRMEQQPPPSRLIRFMESAPTYRLHLPEEFEEYWRENGYFKTIRRVRNRCRDLTLETNAPGSAEWTIRNWEARWRRDPAIADASLSDRLLAAEYLENRGQYHTLQLSDRGTPIGGATIMVHHKVLVAGVLYRDPNYDHYGVGDRLIDLSFTFAVENGFETFDIGGGHEYKKRWAKQEGERWLFDLCPEPLFRAKRAVNWTRGVRNRGRAGTGGHMPVE